MKHTNHLLIILIISGTLFAGCAGSNNPTTSSTQKTATTATPTTVPGNIYDMSIVRSLASGADAGKTFTVTLTLTFNGTKKPGLLGITETYPSNWNVTNITGGGILRQKRSSIEWLFFPPFGPPVQNTTLSYQLTTPKGIEGTYFFEGDTTSGSNEETQITGQDNITIRNG